MKKNLYILAISLLSFTAFSMAPKTLTRTKVFCQSQLFYKWGMDLSKINNVDMKGNTVLHQNIERYQNDDPTFTLSWLEFGADYTLKNNDNKTALNLAEEQQLHKTARALRLFAKFHQAEQKLIEQYQKEKEELLSSEQK